MKKCKRLLCGALVVATILPISGSVFANQEKKSNADLGLKLNGLPYSKEMELINLSKEFSLTKKEVDELKSLYFKFNPNSGYNLDNISYVSGAGAIFKIIKVCKPVLTKAAKWVGGKFTEKAMAGLTDYLFDWQDDLKEGIRSFLVDRLGWADWVARWAAKTIMFLAF